MEILSIVTTGITGIVFSVLVVFIFVNLLKAGNLGALSRWVKKVDDQKDKYGGRILFLNIVFSVVINMIQAFASGDPINGWMVTLKIIGCAFLASGGYEFVKTIAKNMPDFKVGD